MRNKNLRENGSLFSKKRERIIHSSYGFWGFAGLLGFGGIWTYMYDQTIFPFLFFSFFGFFGLFYEGKNANVLKDERYIENKQKATAFSHRLGMSLNFLALIVSGFNHPFRTAESKLLFLVIAFSLVTALVFFLEPYLLYRYDHSDMEIED